MWTDQGKSEGPVIHSDRALRAIPQPQYHYLVTSVIEEMAGSYQQR